LIPVVAALAGLAGALACGGPSFPTAEQTDCSGATTSPNPCDTSTARLPVPDSPELACPTPEEVQAIRADLPVRINGDVSAGVLACREQEGSVDLTVVENNVYQSLLFLRRMRFDRPLPWTTLPVYDWVRATIPNGIVIESSGVSRSCLGCSGPIYVVFSFYDTLRPTVYHLIHTLIVHEARHAEGLRHTCGYSEQYHTATRDRTVAEMGGFGAHYSLEYWLANYSSEAPEVRDFYAKHAAHLLGGGSFCCECGRGRSAARAMGLPALGEALRLALVVPGRPFVGFRECE
jgi:hypothetical protein